MASVWARRVPTEMWERFDPGVDSLRDAIEEDEFWEAAIETDAAVQILCDHSQLDQTLELVERYPELTNLFDHFAHAGPGMPMDEGSFAQFTELAEYDNVAVMVSEMPRMSEESFPYADIHDHVRWLLDTFGRERTIWGSNCQNVSNVSRYAESRHWLDTVDGVSDTDREWLTGRAFREYLGIA